jgi:hypothetical protein
MLPWGSLSPHPGWGEARRTRLTPEEQQTQFVLWAIARSPLILGANLTEPDELTRALITNRNLIDLNQGPWRSRPIINPLNSLPGWSNLRAWTATHSSGLKKAVAVFNLNDQPATVQVRWSDLGVRGTPRHLTDLLSGLAVPTAPDLKATLPPHGSLSYRLD